MRKLEGADIRFKVVATSTFAKPPVPQNAAQYSTHGAMECVNCHLEKATSESVRLQETYMCLSCHSDYLDGKNHSLGKGVIDPRNGQQVTCITCHRLHNAEYPMYLMYKDICKECHK